MTKRSEVAEVSLEVEPASERAPEVESIPFRVLILGDFSGDPAARAPLASRKPHLVDRDNFDEVLRRFRPAPIIPFDGGRADIRVESLDDFHPDRLFERMALFQKLRELRARLSNPSTFSDAAAELGIALRREQPSRAEGQPPGPAREGPDLSSLLDQAITATEGEAADPARPGDLASFIQRVVAPHLTARPDPRQAEIVDVIDQAAAAEMRALLHLPVFQSLEAAWRAIFFLVRRIEDDASQKFYLLDISKAELAADLTLTETTANSILRRILVDGAACTPGSQAWALVVGNYTFHKMADDLGTLRRMARLARDAGAPFVSGADTDLLGCASPADLCEPRKWMVPVGAEGEDQAWRALRQAPEALYLGLALPRFLLRLPYGKETDPTERFDFEEFAGAPERREYLWGNSAFLCASALANAFGSDGWGMRPGHSHEIGGLPLHVYRDNGEAVAAPCAEASLTNDAAERILEAGLMPVAPLRDQDIVRLVRIQSIADPIRALGGRWQRSALSEKGTEPDGPA